MSKVDNLRICVDILQTEFVKVGKRFTDINTQIEENYFLSEKKFNNLCQKKEEISDKFHAIEYGLHYLRSEIENLQYLERMRNKQ